MHLFLVFIALTGCRPEQLPTVDVEFSAPDGVPLVLDVNRPALGNGPWPVIVNLHAGGWRNGTHFVTDVNGPLALTNDGWMVVSPQYRLTDTAIFPAQLNDVRAALAWVESEADARKFDTSRVVLWGQSAGAHLALLAALDGGDAHAVVTWGAITDLNTLETTSSFETSITALLGCERSQCPSETVSAASPVTFATSSAPPIWAEHNAGDPLIPAQQLDALAAAVDVTAVRHDRADHDPADHLDAENLDVIAAWLEDIAN